MERLFFVHLPKTAGTSFRLMLWDAFGADAVFPNAADLAANGGSYPPPEALDRLDPARRAGLRLAAGHWRFWAARFRLPDWPAFTFVREPVARAVSQVRHLQRHDPAAHGLSAAAVVELVLRRDPAFGLNDMARLLAFHPPPGGAGGDPVATACAALDAMAFVGLCEAFDAALDRFAQRFAIGFARRRRENLAPPLDPAAQAALEDLVAPHVGLDRAVYAHAVQRSVSFG